MTELIKLLVDVLRKSVPVVEEQDGIQTNIRTMSPAEALGTEHESASSLLSQIESHIKADRAEGMEYAKSFAEKRIAATLGGYEGMTDTYVFETTELGTKHHADANRWRVDIEKTLSTTPAKAADVARKGSLQYAFSTGQINRLTELGHAINVVSRVNAFEEKAATKGEIDALEVGIAIGRSLEALERKPHEAKVAGQLKASRAGKSESDSNAARNEWIWKTFHDLQAEIVGRTARFEMIAEIMDKGGRRWLPKWRAISGKGVERIIRKREKQN